MCVDANVFVENMQAEWYSEVRIIWALVFFVPQDYGRIWYRAETAQDVSRQIALGIFIYIRCNRQKEEG